MLHLQPNLSLVPDNVYMYASHGVTETYRHLMSTSHVNIYGNCANWLPPQIHTIPPWHQAFPSVPEAPPSSLSLPISGATSTLYAIYLLSSSITSQASLSTMEHSGVAHHCFNTQPCHQWYHISMPNRVKRTLLHQHPSLCQICFSPSLPQTMVCSTAHTCDRVGHLCSVVSSLTHQVSLFLRYTSGLFDANKN